MRWGEKRIPRNDQMEYCDTVIMIGAIQNVNASK